MILRPLYFSQRDTYGSRTLSLAGRVVAGTAVWSRSPPGRPDPLRQVAAIASSGGLSPKFPTRPRADEDRSAPDPLSHHDPTSATPHPSTRSAAATVAIAPPSTYAPSGTATTTPTLFSSTPTSRPSPKAISDDPPGTGPPATPPTPLRPADSTCDDLPGTSASGPAFRPPKTGSGTLAPKVSNP